MHGCSFSPNAALAALGKHLNALPHEHAQWCHRYYKGHWYTACWGCCSSCYHYCCCWLYSYISLLLLLLLMGLRRFHSFTSPAYTAVASALLFLLPFFYLLRLLPLLLLRRLKVLGHRLLGIPTQYHQISPCKQTTNSLNHTRCFVFILK